MRRLAKRLGNDRLYRWSLNVGRTAPAGMADVREATWGLWRTVEPSPVDVPITVFRAHVQLPGEAWDLGWSELTSGEFEVVQVRGYHPYMFVHPHGRKLVEALTAWCARMERRFSDAHPEDSGATTPVATSPS